MIVQMTAPVVGTLSSLKSLWIGKEEVAVEGHSLVYYLDDMKQQGWSVSSASVTPSPKGTLCTYEYKRPLS